MLFSMSVERIWHIRAGMCRKEERHESAADDPENDWRRNGVCRRSAVLVFGLAGKRKMEDRDPAGACAGADPSVWGSGVCGGRYGGDLSEAFRERHAISGDFSGSMYEGLLRAEDVSLQELWENEIMADKTAGMLDREDVMLWREIGMHLGTLDRQTQLQTLHVLQDRLGRSIQDAEKEYQSQAKVYRLVGITGGIFTAILLL